MTTKMNLKEIEALIKLVKKSGVSEVSVDMKDFKITVKTHTNGTHAVSAPVVVASAPPQLTQTPAPAAAPVLPAKPAASDESKYITVRSPMIGTFYRTPAPDKPSFVNVGDDITAGKVLCIIEAMKLFNEIESEVSGKIVKVLVENASPVEYDQPLFLVEPA
jgi:acetyl-CoA carboxylase biotin carboxyl carrier protein